MIDLDNSIKTKFKEHTVNNNTQTFIIVPNEALKVVITIPHDIFEWFVDVLDRNNKKIFSTWMDHYGDTEVNLKSEMKESVEEFILNITRYPLRVIEDRKQEKSVLQIYRNETWVDIEY